MIERQLSSDETHTYQIKVNSGQYLRINIEQFGGDISGVVYGSGGVWLREFQCRPRGPTPVSLISNDGGTHRLDLRLFEAGSTGRYRLKVGSIRTATAEDKSRIAAERVFADGERLRAEWNEQSSHRAIEKYEQALALFRLINEKLEQANTVKAIGDVWRSLNESHRALKYYGAALSISRKANDRQLAGEITNSIGYAFVALGKNRQAMDSGARALGLGQDAGSRYVQAEASDLIGEAYYSFGDLKRALESYQQSLSIWNDLEDRRGAALALLHSGYAYSDLSDTQRALDSYTRALTLWRAVKDRGGEARTLTGMGHLKSKLGEKQEALKLYEEANTLFQRMGERLGAGAVLNGMGYVYDELGEPLRALACYERALQFFRSATYRLGEASSLWRIGRVHYLLTDYGKALDHYHESIRIFRELEYRHSDQYILKDIGMVYDSLGDRQRALDYYSQALALTRARGNRREEAYSLNSIGRAYEALGNKKKGLRYYTVALPLNRATGDRFGESNTLFNIARVQRDLGNLTEARTQVGRAIELAETLRTNVSSLQLRSSYFASARQFYELHCDVLMQMHKQQPSRGLNLEAFSSSEQARARTLLEELQESQADIRQTLDPEILRRERELQQAINQKAEQRAALIAGGKDKEGQSTAKEIDQLNTAYDELLLRIKTENPRYASLTQPQLLSPKEIQQQVLDNDSVLLEYMLGEERSYVWAITRTEISSAQLPARAEIESAVLLFRKLLTVNQPVANETFQQYQERVRQADAQLPSAAVALSDLLIAPVQQKLVKKRLLIVPDGALHYVPFQALTVLSSGANQGERVPLLVNHEIVYEPSASALALVLNEARRPAQKTIAVFANPVFEADDSRVKTRSKESTGISEQQGVVRGVFRDLGVSDGRVPALPASREEAEAILSIVPWGTGLKALDFDANRETVSQPELAQYRIVHFATHGFVDYDHPELSGLVLSLVDENGQAQDGHLRLHDIYNLKLSANLVVLSACNTGLGKEIKGEGLIGLTRGFMYAGADGVVASLWKVDDEATAALMTRFYEGMFLKGLTPAAAMREAQLWMWQQKRWHAPYYWAAFTIQGRYDQTEDVASSRAQWLVISTGFLSAFLLIAVSLFPRRRSGTV